MQTVLEAPNVVVASPAMKELLLLVERAAASSTKVLITGESGVGKDVVARHLHCHSSRKLAPFVAVNCAGLTETLLESELFGHVKGSFTGAIRDKRGKLQLAHRGTLFLDEVGEMSLRMQALLLRFLENGEIQAVGSDHSQARVDVRIVAATNRNLSDLVTAGQFREDLFYRLNVIHLAVPPLRERPEDVRALMAYFLERADRRLTLTDDALRALVRYRWPGNVRELMNVIEQLFWRSTTGVVDVEHLPASMRSAPAMVVPIQDRRRQVADDLYDALVKQGASFWEHVYPLFLARDITRHDVRELVRRGLQESRGRYKGLLELFGMPSTDYRRFMNFLAAHGCGVSYREFRQAAPDAGTAATTPHGAIAVELPDDAVPDVVSVLRTTAGESPAGASWTAA
ncbi:MAG TPA: sigma 54-interacting transcriptional regulator [Vicinamibacterales bacterium]|nr:sigma 54-interacting transcriptional regulator [Vicinamibacterales bacterium]